MKSQGLNYISKIVLVSFVFLAFVVTYRYVEQLRNDRQKEYNKISSVLKCYLEYESAIKDSTTEKFPERHEFYKQISKSLADSDTKNLLLNLSDLCKKSSEYQDLEKFAKISKKIENLRIDLEESFRKDLGEENFLKIKKEFE